MGVADTPIKTPADVADLGTYNEEKYFSSPELHSARLKDQDADSLH